MKTGLLLMLTALCASASGYRILGIFPAPSRSHSNLAKGVVDALLDAGHQVTWATPFPVKSTNKNLTQIDVSETHNIVKAMDMLNNPRMSIAKVREFGRNISLVAAASKAVREVMVKEKFDAVVSEWFFSDIDAGYAAVQQAPWILLNGVVMHPYMEYLIDTPRSVPVFPFMLNDFPVPMNLWHRLQSTFVFTMMMLGTWMESSQTAALYEKNFLPLATARGVPLPPFQDALHNVSIMFVNSHPSFAPAFSLPPNAIEIAGYHIAESTPPLPKDLQDILDASPKGVVYFSMGSVLKSAGLPDRTKKALIKVLGELPYTVLWKFEETIEGLPKNVHIRPWMPQASILAHPNVKVFITHGGLLSTLESIRYGVPVVAIPVFGDQPGNADRSVRAGHALKVKYSFDMADDLKAAVSEMLVNDSYYKRAKEISKLFNSRPVKQSKLISYYVELAIESKGAFHLRSKSRLYKWYELWMLDQAMVVVAILFILYSILKKIIGLFTKKTLKDNKAKKEKKMK